jgi:hypothetical protein
MNMRRPSNQPTDPIPQVHEFILAGTPQSHIGEITDFGQTSVIG